MFVGLSVCPHIQNPVSICITASVFMCESIGGIGGPDPPPENLRLYGVLHLRKPRVLTPIRSLRTCVRNEVELVPLACEDGGSIEISIWTPFPPGRSWTPTPSPAGKCWTPSGSLEKYSFLCNKTIGLPPVHLGSNIENMLFHIDVLT